MGCCLSTTATVDHRQRPPKTPVSHSPPPPPPPPPPPALEEETVKEVLSETPILPRHQPPLTVVVQNPQPEEPRKAETNGADLTKTSTLETALENVSEISEMYSYSESFSAATTTTTTVADNKKDEIEMEDEDEVTQKVKKNRSPPAKRAPRKRPVGSSAVRKERPSGTRQMASSPEKKRQSPSRTTANAPRHRNVGSSNDGRRDGGARRSRSPAVRGETCQSRKVSEKEKRSEVLLGVESTAVDHGGVSPEIEADAEAQTSESLENPLVSLECFIFL